MKQAELLLQQFKIDHESGKLLQCFTHNSFSENNNSRLVFLGQFAFRGKVAEWVFDNIAGTGTQLQHFLGNLFRQKFLETFFDKHYFATQRISPTVDLQTQKHVFVYAFFGLVYENATEEQLEDFIFRKIISPNNHLLPHNYKHKNHWEQLNFLCKQQFDKRPKIQHSEDEDKIHHLSIYLDEELLADHRSISFKYAKKKTVENALKIIGERLERKILQDEVYLQNQINIQEKKIAELQLAKQQKQEKHIARNTAHREKMVARKEELKLKAQEDDRRRRENKEALKEKTTKKKQSIYKEYTLEEIKEMSNSKRRNLQDRGIIPKGIVF